jgi:hypothetical protein
VFYLLVILDNILADDFLLGKEFKLFLIVQFDIDIGGEIEADHFEILTHLIIIIISKKYAIYPSMGQLSKNI